MTEARQFYNYVVFPHGSIMTKGTCRFIKINSRRHTALLTINGRRHNCDVRRLIYELFTGNVDNDEYIDFIDEEASLKYCYKNLIKRPLRQLQCGFTIEQLSNIIGVKLVKLAEPGYAIGFDSTVWSLYTGKPLEMQLWTDGYIVVTLVDIWGRFYQRRIMELWHEAFGQCNETV